MISFRILGTPVKARAAVMIDLLAVWGVAAWLELHWHPGLSIPQSLLIGFAAMVLLSFADFGHAIAHIISARWAGTPMDEVLLSGGMPRTIYSDTAVSPTVHRIRAAGGPLFNAVGLPLSLAVYFAAPATSFMADLAKWSAIGHTLILIGSLLPLPIVDGGTMLKWTLVARGTTEGEADRMVRRVTWVMAIAGAMVAILLIAAQEWMAGLVLVAGSAIMMGIAAGKIR